MKNLNSAIFLKVYLAVVMLILSYVALSQELFIVKLDNPKVAIMEDTMGDYHDYYLILKHGDKDKRVIIAETSKQDKNWDAENVTLKAVQSAIKGKINLLILHPYCSIFDGEPCLTNMFVSYNYDMERDKIFNKQILLGEIKKEGIRAICKEDTTGTSLCYLAYSTGTIIDSIMFLDLDKSDQLQSFSISIKQLIVGSRPEIIIQYKRCWEERASLGNNKTTEIWNPDTKTQVFFAENYLFSEWQEPSRENPDEGYDEFICEYSYDIEFTEDSKIVIKNLRTNKENDKSCEPDNKAGTYKLINNQYILINE